MDEWMDALNSQDPQAKQGNQKRKYGIICDMVMILSFKNFFSDSDMLGATRVAKSRVNSAMNF